MQMDWKGVLLNPNFVRKDWIISWPSYQGLAVGDNVTTQTLLELGRNRQYSFQLDDGSLLQLHYEFQTDGNTLENASLAFYKFNGVYARDSENGEGWTDNEVPIDDVPEAELPVPWMRIDCCPRHRRGAIHSAIHMHCNINPSVRIPVNGVPTPKQFVEATIAWFYPEEYASKLLDVNGMYEDTARVTAINRHTIPCFDDPNARRIMHLGMPMCEQ